MWNRIKSWFSGDDGGGDSKGNNKPPPCPWIEAAESPWGVRCIDVRPVTLGMLSASRDQKAAEKLVALGRDDGSRFVGIEPKSTLQFTEPLRYRIDRMLANGPLFSPREMEHKWGIYYFDGKIIFVRSWTHDVNMVVDTEFEGDFVKLVTQHGSIVGENDNVDEQMERRTLDYLIRSHCLGEHFPVPLEPEFTEDPSAAAMLCMSMFGNMAIAATPHEFDAPMPETPLRTDSIFHIAIAQADHDVIREQLQQGVPIDLLAKDGLAPMHWALATQGNDTLQLLMDAGSPVDVRSHEGATPLMNAVQSDNGDRVQFLLDHGADANAADNRGFTALHRAAEMGHVDIAKVLLQQGADPDADAEGHTPRSLAKKQKHAEIQALLSD